MKKQQILKTITDLRLSFLDNYGKFERVIALMFFPQSNDIDIKNITNLISHPWAKKPKNTLRFAFLIGESAVFSLAEVFEKAQIDAVFLADININMIEHTGFLETTFKNTKTPEEFQQYYLKKHPLKIRGYEHNAMFQDEDEKLVVKKIKLTEENLQKDLDMSMERADHKHFLMKKNFSTYQKIIRSIPFCQFYIDITKEEQMENFLSQVSAAFPGYKIEFVLGNFSNVFDHDAKISVSEALGKKQNFIPNGNLAKNSGILFENTKNPVIMYSTLSLETKTLSSKYCTGVEQFVADLQKYTDEINQTISGPPKKAAEKTSAGLDPLPASDEQDLETKKLLKKYTLTEEKTPIDKNLAFRRAAAKGCLDDLKKLLLLGAQINHQGSGSQKTALHQATISRHFSILVFLLSMKADISIKDHDGKIASDYVKAGSSLYKRIGESIKTNPDLKFMFPSL